MANFPMMAVGIDQTAKFPAMLFADRKDFRCSGFQRAKENCIWIRNSQYQTHRTTAERLWTEIAMLWRFVTYPELRTVYRKPGHDTSARIIQAISLCCAKCGFVKLDRRRTISDR